MIDGARQVSKTYVIWHVGEKLFSNYIGLINFIGLIAPHIVRLVVGNNHVYLLPGSAMAGALILLLGDLFARVVISPIILPIGAITSFLGGPMFLYLLLRRLRLCSLSEIARRCPSSVLGIPATLPHVGATSGLRASGGTRSA